MCSSSPAKYGIKVIAMEVTHESHVEEIRQALRDTGNPTGVMLQIGTRNTQNFELLKIVGRQKEFPVLIKRGFGITLDESLNAAEYLASEGNHKVVFGLRGMKTNLGDPHRNFVDFSHVPVVRRLTRMPVCVDPSHSVGLAHGRARTASSTSCTSLRRACWRARTWCWWIFIPIPPRRWWTGRRRCGWTNCPTSSPTWRLPARPASSVLNWRAGSYRDSVDLLLAKL